MVFSNSQEAAIIVGAVIDNHINALARTAATCIDVVCDSCWTRSSTTGRDLWAFRDVQRNGLRLPIHGNRLRMASPYQNWYYLDFSRRSPFGDPFHYEGWAGHYDLVKLNLRNPVVRQHLFAAISSWVEQYDVDGLRLDAADRLDPDFRRDLAAHCRSLKPDFWLVGEVVHGNYREWANPAGLCSTTNYETHKALWSSHNDKNYFELAHSLDRQFGLHWIYRGLDLYSFADNHDVDRVASWGGPLV
jgi:cyclomaltodextrinase